MLRRLMRMIPHVRRLEDDNARLLDVVTNRITFEEMTANRDGFTMKLGQEYSALLAAVFLPVLDGYEAKNYVQIRCQAKGGRKVVVTIQRAERPTPHELRVIAEGALETVRDMARKYDLADKHPYDAMTEIAAACAAALHRNGANDERA